MLFSDFRHALLTDLRTRVRNGEATERSLAKMAGISQPHMHNVLKGVRVLSPDLGDRLLKCLQLSLIDFLRSQQQTVNADNRQYFGVPILDGLLGPGHLWPTRLVKTERFPVLCSQLSSLESPVVATLASDARMLPIFGGGDKVLLNQCRKARREIDSSAYYLVRRGRSGLIRRARVAGRFLFLMTEDGLEKPWTWERILLDGHKIEHIVRARALFLAGKQGWLC